MIDSRLLYSAWPIRALAIATACIAALPAVRAETDLIESTWVSESPKCTIREIKFYDFAHAHSVLYGMLAVMIAVSMGLGASSLMRRI